MARVDTGLCHIQPTIIRQQPLKLHLWFQYYFNFRFKSLMTEQSMQRSCNPFH